MNRYAILVGSPAFLRLWSFLGCKEYAISRPDHPEKLKKIISVENSAIRVVLYEETLLDRFSGQERKYFQESAEPCWIPLPSADGGES